MEQYLAILIKKSISIGHYKNHKGPGLGLSELGITKSVLESLRIKYCQLE